MGCCYSVIFSLILLFIISPKVGLIGDPFSIVSMYLGIGLIGFTLFTSRLSNNDSLLFIELKIFIHCYKSALNGAIKF